MERLDAIRLKSGDHVCMSKDPTTDFVVLNRSYHKNENEEIKEYFVLVSPEQYSFSKHVLLGHLVSIDDMISQYIVTYHQGGETLTDDDCREISGG